MASHGSDENGLNLEEDHIAYHELYTVASEAVAGFAQLYAYGIPRSKFLTELLGDLFSICKTLLPNAKIFQS